VGATMFLAWTVIVGPVGFLLLLGEAYAMVTSNMALGVVCGLLALSPLFLTIAWAVTAGVAFLAERSVAGRETVAATSRS